MGDLKDKYLTSENMWVLNLPKFLVEPVFSIVWFKDKIKYTWQYVKFLWKTNSMFDLDYYELLECNEFKLNRMKQQLKNVGNPEASKQVEQSLLYLEQYRNAEEYVTLPEELQGKDVGELISISMNENGSINVDLNMSDETSKEYKEYLDELVCYEEDSWNLFWDSLKQKATNWM